MADNLSANQPKEMPQQPMAVIHEDVPTGCDACGRDIPVQTVNVEHEDGTPTSLNLCADCRTNPPANFCGNAVIDQLLDQASATAASKQPDQRALLARRIFWDALSDAGERFYVALRRAGMDQNRAAVWVINALQTETERLDNHWPNSWETHANDENRPG